MKTFIISDIHGSLDTVERAADLLSSADMVIIAGDITRSGTVTEAEKVIGAVERHNSSILAVHGNWDSREIGDYLAKNGCGLHATGRIIGNTGFFGLGGSSPTPMHTRCEYTEDQIADFLVDGLETVKTAPHRVLISHVPPRGVRDRTFLGLRGGSTAVREFLEKNSVDLCLCGHIHEAGGIESLGPVIVANPGSFKRGKYLTAELNGAVTISRGKIRKTLSWKKHQSRSV